MMGPSRCCRSWILIISLVSLTCGRRAVDERRVPSPPPQERFTMSNTAALSTPKTPIAGIFPPAWQIGQEWRVVCKTEVPKADMPSPDPKVFRNIFFRFRVVEVPDGIHLLYRVNVFHEGDEGEDTAYALFYRPNPFSLDHFRTHDRDGWSGDKKNGERPFVRSLPNRLILDFPIMPSGEDIFKPFTFQLGIDDPSYTQIIRRIEGGIRITLESKWYRLEFVWKKDEPWWESVDLSYAPSYEGQPRQFNGSGRLLR